ncbi:MAG: hypothetical protein RMI01_08455, partial [Thermodesulfovibrio sp.]|nr:hypothetical protein [Thermodesulfovibrio sp.]
RSNYWLNSIFMKDRQERDEFLKYTNANGVITRPVWRLMHRLKMYENCFRVDLSNSEEIEQKLVNIPSGVRV